MIDPKLHTLLAILEEGSYTKAAQKLSLTQPAVSQHVKQLEEEFGIRLFNRTGGKIRPTEEGALVVRYAKRSIALHKNLFQAIADERRHLGRLAVGVTHTAESNAVTEVLGRYASNHPSTAIRITTGTIGELHAMLKHFELDVAVVEGSIQDPDIESLLLDTDSLMLVVSNNHPLAGKSMITMEELQQQPLILRSPSSGTRSLFEAHLESHNLSLADFNVIFEVDNVATIKDLIRRDIGASVLSKSVCLDELKKDKITVLPIENLSMVREINILYHADLKHFDVLSDIVKEYNRVVRSYLT